jgi:iron complex outermembrane receptor protein
MPLEQLMALEVVTASRFPQRVTEAPSAVTIITADDIRTYGHRTLADALRSVRGLHVSYDRNYAYLGVQGFGRTGDYNSRVLLLIDGVRANDNIYDQATIGTEFPLDLELVERIEFVPGPGSSIYGSNAVFGVINVITRRGADLGGPELTAAAGSFGTTQGRASWGGRSANGTDLLVSVSGMGSRGGELDFDRNRQLFARASYGPWSLQLVHGERTKGIPTAAFGTAPGVPGTQTADEWTTLGLRYAAPVRPDIELAAQLSYGNYRYGGDYVYEVPPLVTNRDETRGTWWGAEARAVSTAWRDHKVVAGIEYQTDRRKDQLNFDVEPFASYLEDRRRGRRSGVYLQDEIAIRPGLRLNAGVRYDLPYTGSGVLNPRLALIWNPVERAAVKLLHGSAYRAPNAYELSYAAPGPGGQKGNLDLKVERIRTSEAVAEYFVSPGLRLQANVFRYAIRDLIEQTVDPADGMAVFRNTGAARTTGAGLEIERRWASGARLRASYSTQRAVDGGGAWLVNSPRHLAKLAAAAPFGGGWRAGGELQYTSKRRTLAGEAPGFTVANLTLALQMPARGPELSVSLYNAFDKRYSDPAGPEHAEDRIAQDGRALLARLRLRF